MSFCCVFGGMGWRDSAHAILELMMRELSTKYKRIAERLITSEDIFTDIRELGIRIAYLSSDEEKKKDRRLVHADCTKVDKKYKKMIIIKMLKE